MSFDPDLFLDAQDRVWDQVLRELRNGQKTSHWIWFVFPQLDSLGRSPTARRFGIPDLDSATAYLDNATLRARLVQAATLMLNHQGTEPDHILGAIDAMKLRSSMTLFSAVPGAPSVFGDVLDAFYDGQPCPHTIAAIKPA